MRTENVSERSEATTISKSSHTNGDGQKRNRDWLIPVLLFIGVALIFWKTTLLGVPISKLSRIVSWDSMFASIKVRGTVSYGLMDPSLIQLMVPYYMLVAKLWHVGHIPLWNQFSASGVPLLADPQSLVFSPLHMMLSICPSMRVYNILLVFQLGLGAVGTYLFARELKLDRVPSVAAALSFTFCPFLIWFLELIGNGYMFYPIVFWSFARLAAKPTLSSVCLSAVTIACMIFSGHPEISFYGAGFGALFAVLLISSAGSNARIRATRKTIDTQAAARFLIALIPVSLVALLSFALSAPVLLPFLEYLKTADCYKLSGHSIEHIPWQALVVNLFQPALGSASLYLGALPLITLPFCYALSDQPQRKKLLALLTTCALAEALTSSIWPIGPLLTAIAPSLIPNYCQPVCLLLLSVSAAFGFQGLLKRTWTIKSGIGKSLIAATILAMLFPLILRLLRAPLNQFAFDSSLQQMHLSNAQWLYGSCAAIAITVFLFRKNSAHPRMHQIFGASCVIISLLIQLGAGRQSMPPQAEFEYPLVESVKALAKAPGRFIAVGDHLMKPNTNVVYGLSDLRFHNPMFPARYRAFMSACGAHLDGFNESFDGSIGDLIGLANVTRIVSTEPVWTKQTVENMPLQAVSNKICWPGVELTSVCAACDKRNKQIVGKLGWRFSPRDVQDLTYSVVILDRSGKVEWFSDQRKFSQDRAQADAPTPGQKYASQSTSVQEFGAVIAPIDAGQTDTLGLRIFDNKKLVFVAPFRDSSNIDYLKDGKTNETLRSVAGSTQKLLTVDNNTPIVEDPNFQLIDELSNNIRIYKNATALPAVYLTSHIEIANSPAEALSLIQAKNFDRLNDAVVELNDKNNQLHLQPTAVRVSSNHLDLKRVSAERAVVTTDCQSKSLLVLTDTFFPGWQSRVDGNPAEILRTNTLFRGVIIPPGKHQVVFEYRPSSFIFGLMLSLTAVVLIIFTGLFSLRNKSLQIK